MGGALGLAIVSTIAANRTASRLASAPGDAPHALVSGYDLGFPRDLTAIDAQAPVPALRPEES